MPTEGQWSTHYSEETQHATKLQLSIGYLVPYTNSPSTIIDVLSEKQGKGTGSFSRWSLNLSIQIEILVDQK